MSDVPHRKLQVYTTLLTSESLELDALAEELGTSRFLLVRACILYALHSSEFIVQMKEKA